MKNHCPPKSDVISLESFQRNKLRQMNQMFGSPDYVGNIRELAASVDNSCTIYEGESDEDRKSRIFKAVAQVVYEEGSLEDRDSLIFKIPQRADLLARQFVRRMNANKTLEA